MFYEIYPEEKKKDIVDLYAESPMFKAFVDSNIKSIFRFDKTTGFSIEDFEKEKIYYQVEYNNRIYSLYNNGKEINQLMFLSDSFGPCNDFNHSIGLRKIRGDWWKDFYKDMGNVSKEGNVEYKNGKKPLRLIQQIIKMSSTSHSTILDFFGGSATTAHATILENLEDNGARQFIICQSQEKEKICENKTYRRIYNSMQGYYLDSGKQVTGLGNSLKYYRTDFVGKHTAHLANDEDRVLLAQKAGCLMSLCENTLEEIETTKYYQIFTDGKRFTGVYFSDDTEQLPEFVGEIESKDALTAVYIFCWGSPDIYENEFNDLKKITIKAIPQSILEIYKTIYSGEE